ncbi:hypothetical protein JCM8547_009136 [Rhodosporidiobolus lusitaniae]
MTDPAPTSCPLPSTLPADASLADRRARLARIKRQVVGSSKAKEGLLKAGEVPSLVALLVSSPETTLDDSLALSAEAASVLAALSLPTLTAVSTLLSSSAHVAVVRALSLVLSSSNASPNVPQATQHKLLESHLRALRALHVDLVKVVGPREWGTEVVGASIDVEERRDVESLWLPQKTKASEAGEGGIGKGKERENDEDVAMSGAEGSAGVDLAELKRQAEEALDAVFRTSSTAPSSFPDIGSSSASSAVPSSSASLPSALVDLLVSTAQFDPASPSPVPFPQRMRLADLVCSFISGVVRHSSQRETLTAGEKGREGLAALRRLAEHGDDKVRESAMKALTVLVHDHLETVLALLNLGIGPTPRFCLAPICPLLSASEAPVRLAAATLLAVVIKTLCTSRPTAKEVPDEEFGPPLTQVLLNIIEKEPELRARAGFAFAYLVADQPQLQAKAINARAMSIFHSVLSQPMLLDQPYPTPAALEADARVREGILLSLASLAALYEPHRRLILDASLLPHLLTSLSHPIVGVRAAACHCIRGLSRSVNVLRTDLVEAHAEEQLVWLLREEENGVVKITASAAVANLLLEFSPMRNVLVEAGCIPRMCSLATKSANPTLRLNAMWALKNATYQSSTDFKRALLQHLTWDHLAALISAGSPPAISEQALGILRNITCVTNNEAITGLAPGELGEDRLLGLLEEKVAGSGVEEGRWEEGVVQALYCLNNIATAHEAAQLAIASRTTLLRYVLSYLDSPILTLRVASLWVLHNLIYRRGASSSYLSRSASSSSSAPRQPQEIVDKLRALGLDGMLRKLERDPELDVRERVKDLKEGLAV